MTATTPRPPGRGRVGAPARTGSLLGQWNSAVTSYYVLIGAAALLLVIGLVMVLSSSSVESLDENGSPYAVFLDQAKFALLGLPVMFGCRGCPCGSSSGSPGRVLGAAIVVPAARVHAARHGVSGNQNWVRVGGISAQPSEAIKLALAVWLGAVLARKLPAAAAVAARPGPRGPGRGARARCGARGPRPRHGDGDHPARRRRAVRRRGPAADVRVRRRCSPRA